jgi:hypothetical protein
MAVLSVLRNEVGHWADFPQAAGPNTAAAGRTANDTTNFTCGEGPVTAPAPGFSRVPRFGAGGIPPKLPLPPAQPWTTARPYGDRGESTPKVTGRPANELNSVKPTCYQAD